MSDRRARLSIGQARAIALRAQGFGNGAQAGAAQAPGAAAVRGLIRRLGALQIDSVNVLVRSHYLPAFSRMGAYDRALLDGVAYGKPRRVFEYWGHEASYLPIELFPFMRWRMEQARAGKGMWANVARVGREERALIQRIRAAFEERGPLGASDFTGAKNRESWWGWSDTKRAVEFLYWCGELTPVGRRTSFERTYDLTQRVIPAPLLESRVTEEEAFAHLVDRAARAFGISTEADLRDYFRLPLLAARTAVAALAERGTLLRVGVEGWKAQAYLHRDARIPRAIDATALVSPFDSLVWNRERTHRLFNFHYRIEIYTPAHKRVHGYYVLPYLLDGRLSARVDLKADRANSALLVQAVHYEPGRPKRTVLPRLREDLAAMAEWLALERITLPRSSR
ncbi:MAG: winged helix-turn-helix domain-containing protein [Candidatus Baltobacteraceae bacterium]